MDIQITDRTCPTCTGSGRVPDVTGETLRQIRLAGKTADGVSPLPQAPVARAMGISPAHLNDIEHGRRRQESLTAELVDGFLRAVQEVAATKSPAERRPNGGAE